MAIILQMNAKVAASRDFLGAEEFIMQMATDPALQKKVLLKDIKLTSRDT